jgi:hypothetical protein
MSTVLVSSRMTGQRVMVMRAGSPRASGWSSDVVEEHLRADADETDARWLSIADVIVRSGGVRLTGVFDRYPGCLIAATAGPGDRCVVGGRDGWSISVMGCCPRMHGWYASFAHFWIVSGRSSSGLAHTCVTISGSGRLVAVIGPKP